MLIRWVPLIVLLSSLMVFYAQLILPGIVGVNYDEGLYVLGAKALALGKGYYLLSDPSQPAIVKYPPLFPLVLSGLWRLHPVFPDNIVTLKAFNSLLAVAALAILYGFSKRIYKLSTPLAFCVVALTGFSVQMARCASHILSEPLFLLLTAITLWLAATLHQRGSKTLSRLEFMLLLGLSVLAVYTRSIGISLMLSLSVWLAFKVHWRTGLSFLGASLLLILPWFWWCSAQPETFYRLQSFYVVPYNQTYLREYQFTVFQGKTIGFIVVAGLLNFPTALIECLIPRFGSWLSAGSNLILSIGLLVSSALGVVYRFLQNRSFSPVGLYIVAYMGLAFIWCDQREYSRLLMMIVPYLLILLFSALQQQALLRKLPEKALPFGLVTITAITLCFSYSTDLKYLLPARGSFPYPAVEALWPNYEASFQFIRQQIKPSQTIASSHSMLFPLYTQRHVVISNVYSNPEDFKGMSEAATKEKVFNAVMTAFKKEKIQYLIHDPDFDNYGFVANPKSPYFLSLIQAFPNTFKAVYQSPNGWVSIYRVTLP